MKNLHIILFLSASIILTSCKFDEQPTEIQGRSYAKAAIPEVHYNYLKCYALKKHDKKECTDKLIMKYMRGRNRTDKDYTDTFQFESEKQVFKRFINYQELPCESIEKGPEFIENKKAYLVQCKPNNQYYMQFDYVNKEWKLAH